MSRLHLGKCIPLILLLLLLPYLPEVGTSSYTTEHSQNVHQSHTAMQLGGTPIPLQKLTVVNHDPHSYLDEFAYMAAVPTSTFVHDGTQYTSPLLLHDGSQSEQWLIEDWVEYLNADGGLSQAIGIGDLDEREILSLQEQTGVQLYPVIRGATSTDIAAQLALMDWTSSDTAVFALAVDEFPDPEVITGSQRFTFEFMTTTEITPNVTVSSSDPVTVQFMPISSVGWLEGSFDWTSDTHYFTHTLRDPLDQIVDYSVWSRTYHERFSTLEPVPLNFWVPRTMSGAWNVDLIPQTVVDTPIDIECTIRYHPGFTHTIDVPANTKMIDLAAIWDNAQTDINLALIDPSGRMVQWAPVGSVLSSPGTERIQVPYPMPGEWSVVIAWMDANEEQNNVDLSWQITTIAPDIQDYLESAANGAVLASLLNAPLLYVTPSAIPELTQWVVDRLGVSISFLVDPMNIHLPSLEDALHDFSVLTSISTYPGLSSWIQMLSGERDVVVSVPLGGADELFAPASFSAAFHGAPIFSLCGDNNLVTTRAEETWAPYLIGPEIDVFITNQYTTRTENGWYDERIPNKYSMMKSVDDFSDFLDDRMAYNASQPQSVVIVAPTDLVKVSFDRSLNSHYAPGRFPTEDSSLASVMIARGTHHRFLFRSSESPDDALLSLYAYTDGGIAYDNEYNSYTLHQYEQLNTMLQDGGFTIKSHVGINEVFAALDTQVSFWSYSTHGTLTRYPTDPPERPSGPGLFSLRTEDLPYGMENSTHRDAGRPGSSIPDGLVNPVLFTPENGYHVISDTEEMEANIGNIGSPIVHVTACLLGGSTFPAVLMEHGAVGVISAPRTVYFRAAGLLSVLFTESLVVGNSTGEALRTSLSTCSIDYSDPLPDREPWDYANQQVLYGDPEVHLYEPAATQRVESIDHMTTSFGFHNPSRGVNAVAGLGASEHLPSALSPLDVDFDYYEVSNYTEFSRLLSLRRTVVIESDTLQLFTSLLTNDAESLDQFVRGGGTLVILGVSGDLSWMPWEVSFQSSATNMGLTITDTTHPLLSVPNELSTNVETRGFFDTVGENLTVLATDGSNPVFVAITLGSGKLALSTTHPNGTEWNNTIENIIRWNDQPAIVLRDIYLSQYIIWEGDRVVITIELTDTIGAGIPGVALQAWMNSTSTETAEEVSPGIYTITLTEVWTTNRTGVYDLRLHGTKLGYDTISLTLEGFMFIRPSPLPLLLIAGGVFGAIIIGVIIIKYRRGDAFLPRRGKSRYEEKSREEKERQRKKDEEFDAEEFFGV